MDPARSVDDICIRKAGRKDFDFILHLSVETMQSELSAYEREHTTLRKLIGVMTKTLRALMGSSGMLTLVAETDDGRPAGFIMVGRSASVFTDQQQAFVYDVAVSAEFRRRGIGRFLMEHAEAHARRLRMSHVALMVDMANAPARALYAKLGFSDAKVLMRKQLGE
jgi:ribosomal protein S18 acetylase RimI-like enzyme